jgi:hypothetical protein
VLDFVEEAFDQVPSPVKIWTEAQRLCPISLGWDIRPSTVLSNKGSDSSSIGLMAVHS